MSASSFASPLFAARIVAGVALLGVACSAGEGAGPDPSTAPLPTGAGGANGSSAIGLGGGSGAGSEAPPPINGIAGNTGVGGGSMGAGNGGSVALAGSGGSGGGASGSSAGGTGGAAAAACEGNGVFVCDDFESGALGAFPNGPAWDPNSCTSHRLDDTLAHSGTQSLRGGAEMYPACMAHADITGENQIYARSWIRLGGASTDSGHEIGFLEFGPTLADNPELRVGLRNNDSVCMQAPGVEVTVDGVVGGERTTCSGVALDADRWYCLQVHFARAPGSITFSVQIDGNSVVPETVYTDAVAAWSDGPMFLKLGRSSYGGNNVWPVWHDDVVLSSEPLGCGP